MLQTRAWHRRPNIVVGLVLLASQVCSACVSSAADAAGKAGVSQPGDSVVRLVADIGQPTVNRSVDKSAGKSDPCGKDDRNVRAFEYHVPGRGATRTILSWLGQSSISSMTVVCIDANERVTSTHVMQF